MKKTQKIKENINNYLFDHIGLKLFLDYFKSFILCVVSGFIFAFGFSAFISPQGDLTKELSIVTGGVSGISQNIYLAISFFNDKITLGEVTSICYFALNVPILVFAFFAIGKKFAIFSLINVLVSSIFIRILPGLICNEIGQLLIEGANGGIITRVLFGSLCTGVSSALAFRGNMSCGGVDIFTYYFALRKSTSVGKYAVLLNGLIITVYTILSIVKRPNNWEVSLLQALFAVTYVFMVSLIIDAINVRNKKVQVQIITSKPHMGEVLLANFPHSATIMNGKGAYSGSPKFILYMTVSSVEVNRVVNLCKRVDEHVFISVTPLIQVYGNFFIKPVE